MVSGPLCPLPTGPCHTRKSVAGTPGMSGQTHESLFASNLPMKITTTAALVFACLALASCKSAPKVSSTFPEIGATATEEVGEHLITQGTGISRGAIAIPFDQSLGEYLVMKGKYAASGQNSEYVRFSGVALQNKTTQRTHRGNLYLFAKDKYTKTICLSRKSCGELEFAMDKATAFHKNSFQQTLIYSGKIGNRVTLSYREFVGGFARPAFSNDVTYDLSESKILGYKGARLEVIDATNTEITYKVLKEFD